MRTTRRDFIRISLLTGSGTILIPSKWADASDGEHKFDFEIGVCTEYDRSGLLKESGYSFVEELVRRFLVPTESEEKFVKILEATRNYSLPVKALNSFLPAELKCVGPNADPFAILKFAETSFRRAHVAGIGIIVLGSGKARQIPEGFSGQEARRQFVELSREMAPLAEKYKVTIVLEPLNKEECNFINSVAEAGDIVKEVNHPNFLLLADLYHMSKEGESPESILRYGHLLRHVHIAEKAGRAAPGTTHEDFTEYFRALRRVRYRGLISIECQWQNMEKQLPVAIQALRAQTAG